MIDTKLLLALAKDFEACLNGSKKHTGGRRSLRFEKNASQNSLATSMRLIVFSLRAFYPAWLQGQFYLYNQLIRNEQCPCYHHVTVNCSQHFVLINKKYTILRVKTNADERSTTEIDHSMVKAKNHLCNFGHVFSNDISKTIQLVFCKKNISQWLWTP